MDSIILKPVPLDSTRYYRINSQRLIGKPARPKPKVEPEPADSITDKS